MFPRTYQKKKKLHFQKYIDWWFYSYFTTKLINRNIFFISKITRIFITYITSHFILNNIDYYF